LLLALLFAASPQVSLAEGTESALSKAGPIARLQQRVNAGEVELEFDPRHGYLPSLLKALKIPVSSQTLVFSKTSAQFRLISPEKPRALYFNDDVYVGWVQNAPFVEISAADPNGGGVFFKLDQVKKEKPRFERGGGECLECHESVRTLRIPGHLTRSVYPAPDGHAHLSQGSTDVDQSTPIEKRWGGWYVTGKIEGAVHRGNATIEEASQAPQLDAGPGAGRTDLSELFGVEPYLSPHSDIVAHLVLAHQTQMHNHIARTAMETRKTLDYMEERARLFGGNDEHAWASARRRIENPSEDLLRYMLFADEAPLPGPVEGTSSFAEEFQKLGPHDSQGRSLRDLDLNTRMFRYPCSYLIYSEAFLNLPEMPREYIYRRLFEVLSGKDQSEDFAHLSVEDRTAIRRILEETHPEIPRYWNALTQTAKN